MTEFAKRQGPRMNLQPESWGADVPSGVVDEIAKTLEQSFSNLGFRSRDYSAAATPKITAGHPTFELIARLGGEATIEALEKPIKASAFFRDSAEPRQEAVFLDDGGTIISGAHQGDIDKVLKITVRDVNGLNADVRSQVEECLLQHDIDPAEARRGLQVDESTVIYALKRCEADNI